MVGNLKVIKFFAFLTILIAAIGGALFGSYKVLTGDFNIFDSLGKLVNVDTESRVNGLILGTDEGRHRTDFIMFVSYNPKNKKINMISIPRDTRVSNSVDKKINSLFTKGKQYSVMKDVEDILGQSIDYYAVVDFKGFRKIVDDIGGIPMDVPISMKYHDPYQNLNIDIDKGYQVLDGRKAEGFVRFRKGYADADLGRIKAQHEFINAAIAQILKPQNIPKIPSIIRTLKENVETDMSTKQMLAYVDDIAKINKDSITMESLPGEPKYIGGGSYFIYDKLKTEEMMNRILSNEEDIPDQAVIERNKSIKVEVYNGTDIFGLGSKVSEQLKEKGFQVIKVDNYEDTNVNTTKILERNRKVEGAYVKNALRVGDVKAEYDETSEADITVILGQDVNR